MLKKDFIPVAIDQAYQRRQQDTEGEFYRKIASQGPRDNFNSTTQGFYVATAAGELLLYNNNRNPEKVRNLMAEKLKEFRSRTPSQATPLKAEKTDPRFNVSLPDGGLVVRVRAKVMGGYEPTTDRWRRLFQTALSRDNLWISKSEHRQLAAGKVAESLQQRIARFHLVDNTRGEPPMWEPHEIRSSTMSLKNGVLTGHVELSTRQGDRTFSASIRGHVQVQNDQVVRFDVVATGDFEGEGRYTGGAPKGKFPLAVSFELADGTDVADRIPPQGSRGWLRGYLK